MTSERLARARAARRRRAARCRPGRAARRRPRRGARAPSAILRLKVSCSAKATTTSRPRTSTGWASARQAASRPLSARTASRTAGHSVRTASRSGSGASAAVAVAALAVACGAGSGSCAVDGGEGGVGAGAARLARWSAPRRLAGRAGGAAAPAPASAASRRSTRAISARAPGSTSGAAALTSAASRRVRASAPSLTVRRASARRSSRRTRLDPGTREACSARRSSRSGVRRSSAGTSPSVCTTSRSRAWASRSLRNWAMSRPVSARRARGEPGGARVAGGHGVEGLEEQVGVGDAEHGEDVLGGDVGARVGHELLERAQRVAERAGRVAREQGDGVGRDLDRLRGGHARDDDGDLLDRRAREVEAVAAVDDRRQHLLGLGRGEDEDRVGRRLLERLEERVPGLRGEHVRLVEDVDLRAPGHRRELHGLAQLADVVDGVVGRRVHLDDVQRRRAGDGHARLADARTAPPSARSRSSCTPRASSPSTSCPSPASPRTGRHGEPSPAARRCAGSSRHAPGQRRRRTCAGGGGGTTMGRRSRTSECRSRVGRCADLVAFARVRCDAFAGTLRGCAREGSDIASPDAHTPLVGSWRGWPNGSGEWYRWRSCAALGVCAGAIEHRVRVGRLHRVHRGVYAVGHRALRPRATASRLSWPAAPGRCSATAAPPRTGACSAPTRSASTSPRPATRHGVPGIRLHRSRSLDARDTTSHEGIPITTIARTLLDLAATARASSSSGRWRRPCTCASTTTARSPTSSRRCQRAPRHGDPHASDRDRAQGHAQRMGGPHAPAGQRRRSPGADLQRAVPRPRSRPCKPDFHWPGHDLIVETDGWDSHSTRAAFEDDRAKDAALTAAGYRVVRFTWLTEDATIRHAPARAASAPGPGQVALARGDGDRLVPDVVADLDRAADDAGQGAGAAVLHEPLRAAHGGRAVLARRPEGALAVAPEVALARLLLGRRARRAPARRGMTPAAAPARAAVIPPACVTLKTPS